MLKLASKDNLNDILAFCQGDLLGTRIGCYCLSYGFDFDFLKIWIDDSEGVVKTVLAKFYDTITLKTDAESTDEVSDFIAMIGYSTLEMSLKTSKSFGLEPTEIKKAYIFDGKAKNLGAVSLNEEYYKPLYELVSENIPGSFSKTKEGYLSFLSDLTYKSRRGLARCKGIIDDSKLASSVITSAETENAALLSAVACSIESRGKGFGKATVLTITDELIKEGKMVFVIALNASAEGFYEKIGFRFYDYISIIR